jgi:DNA-binding MarR family transcriptional regulator
MDIDKFSEKFEELFPDLAKGFMRTQQNELVKGNISLPQFFVLNYLYRKGESIMSDISKYMSTTLSASTGIINRMVKTGLIARHHDENDRRLVKIHLTQKGRKIVEKILDTRSNMIKETFGRLSGEDREKYLEILYKVRSILDTREGAG